MRKALLYLHLAVFLAGFTGVLGRYISLNESLLVWYRLLITVLTMTVMYVSGKGIPRISWRDFLAVVAVGGIVALHWVSFYGSIKYANVSIALVCFSTLGFFSSLMEPLLLRKKFSIVELLLGTLAILGVFLIFQFDVQYKTGILFGLVSAVLAALFTILNKSLLKRLQPSTVSYYELMGGFLILSCCMPLYLHYFHARFSWPTGPDWLSLLLLSWLCTILAFYLSLYALNKVSPFTVNLSYNLEPVYGIILAFLIYHENERLGRSFYAGLVLILLAVVIQTIRVYRKNKRLSEVQPHPG